MGTDKPNESKDQPSSNPFDPANLKLSQNFGASAGVKKHSQL
jgi:hypothetical protein